MNLIHHKLRSRRGASLSIALLLFLVCLAVASVVLAAGTAASGRLSELREADQRYYSVTSAAELVRDMIGDQTVTFTQERTTYASGDDDSVDTEWNKDVLLENATIQLVFGSTDDVDVDTADAWILSGLDPSDCDIDEFTITPPVSENVFPVHVEAKVENGDLVFYFNNLNKNGTEASERFYIKMTCTPQFPRPEAATVTSPNDTTTVLTRNVNVEWKRANCIIERTVHGETVNK